MKYILFISFIFLSCSTLSPRYNVQSTDFTAENLFTQNIEGPAFDKAGNLYVVNFQKNGTIGKIDTQGNCELFVTLPESSVANAIQFNAKGEMLLADWTRHNILRVSMTTKIIDTLCHNDHFNQPNDICINKRDQLFASDPNWKESTGKLWRIDPNGAAALLEENMGTTNGIELSPDEKILYLNESVQRNVWKYDLDEAGNISNKQLFFHFDDFGMDGMKCDKNGNLYIARFEKGVIAVLSPEGKLLREVRLQGKNCTNLVFGGSDGKTIFVTMNDRKNIEQFRNSIPGKLF